MRTERLCGVRDHNLVVILIEQSEEVKRNTQAVEIWFGVQNAAVNIGEQLQGSIVSVLFVGWIILCESRENGSELLFASAIVRDRVTYFERRRFLYSLYENHEKTLAMYSAIT